MAVICPICKSASVARVLAQRDIRVSDENGHKKVGAELSAFRCKTVGHIFFVLVQDLKASAEERQSDWGT